uniref:Putative phage regulatory protein, Rha family n=1 Tax=Magnetococcus massalia (strain MO-1) TaxID=451514 RepID=A0A1S7LPV1_MAGMO|nr:putative phage regulatory protein, Rha family [Candidatus Magnetococcus massalia]
MNSRGGRQGTQPIVHIKDGEVYANSRDVAEFFEKQHKNVLQGLDALDCSEEFSRLNFQPWEEAHPVVVGRMIRSFDMTKDGFTFLVMGFTGSKAAAFKEAYIQRFNEMTEELKAAQEQYEIPKTYAEALMLAAEQTKRVEEQLFA